MPDIDIDLPDIYRSEFLRYVRNRYGSDHSAQIVTFSTFGPKQAIRDVFKRFGVPEYELTNLTKKLVLKIAWLLSMKSQSLLGRLLIVELNFKRPLPLPSVSKEIQDKRPFMQLVL